MYLNEIRSAKTRSQSKKGLWATACLTASLMLGGQVRASHIDYPDFSSVDGLVLNPAAAVAAGNVLRLTPDEQSRSGSAFTSSPRPTPTEFETTFQIQISGSLQPASRSDGMAFVIHSDPRGAMALGRDGGNLGYADDSGGGLQITPSVVIEFDIHQNAGDPNASHVGLMLNGDHFNHVAHAAIDGLDPLDDGDVKNVRITYDQITHELNVYVAEYPNDPQLVLSAAVDLAAQIGPEVYFGFTAGTGGGRANHDVLNWRLVGPKYGCIGFEAPLSDPTAPVVVHKRNRALPIKAALVDKNGASLTDLEINAPPVIQVLYDAGIGEDLVDVSDETLAVGLGTEGNQFEFTDDLWRFNLKLSDFVGIGTYTVKMVPGDFYSIDPPCAGTFVIDR